MFVSPACDGAKSAVAAPAAVPTDRIDTVWPPIVSGAPGAKFVTEATLRTVSPALTGAAVVVFAAPVPTAPMVRVSLSTVTVLPLKNPVVEARRSVLSPAADGADRVLLPWRQ